MNEFLLLTIVAFQLGQCPVQTDTTSAGSSTLQKRPETKAKLTFVFAPPSTEEPSASFALLMWSNGSLVTFNRNILLFDPKAEAGERKKQLLSVSSCLKKGNDGIHRLDIYLESDDTRYATAVMTLTQLKAVIEPVLPGDAVICIRPYGKLK